MSTTSKLTLPRYDESEVCAEGFLIYLSTHQTIERIAAKAPLEALQVYLALSRYNFYGEEYTGDSLLVESVFNSERQHIDNQRSRYAKAKQGGRKGETIPFDEILSTIATGRYSTLAAVGEALGTSGQNIGKRLKNQGYDFKQLLAQAQSQLRNANETAVHQVSFPETNPTNTNTNTNIYRSFEEVSNEPRVSNEFRSSTPISDMLVEMELGNVKFDEPRK